MSDNAYALYWVTDKLATGPAPMSYDHLDHLKAAGIDAIMNLCAEYCDLHDIESGHGFEVYYLPVEDEETPQLQALDKALDWLDEAIYLGKKVYVHCRYGIGRTGTIISSYLLRRGLGSKVVKQKLKKMRSRPANFYQWWLVRKIGKREGKLTIREPSLEWKSLVDLSPFFFEFEALLNDIDSAIDQSDISSLCGTGHSGCCCRYVEVSFIEAAYLMHSINKKLHSAQRLAVIERCGELNSLIRQLRVLVTEEQEDIARLYNDKNLLCPLSLNEFCLIAAARPLACRFFDLPPSETRRDFELLCRERAKEISQGLFLALSGSVSRHDTVSFPLVDVASGKFVQSFFHLLARQNSFNDTEKE